MCPGTSSCPNSFWGAGLLAFRLDVRGNMGTQFYAVPADVEIGGSPWTVLIWCQTFDVPIANATPA